MSTYIKIFIGWDDEEFIKPFDEIWLSFKHFFTGLIISGDALEFRDNTRTVSGITITST